MRTCIECDKPARSRGLYQAHYHHARRATITRARTTDTLDRLSDLEWLIDGGVWPPSAAERVGWTVDAAEQAARRHGYSRVARVLRAHIREAAA